MRTFVSLLALPLFLAGCALDVAPEGEVGSAPAPVTEYLGLRFLHSRLCVEPEGGYLGAPRLLRQYPCASPASPAAGFLPMAFSTAGRVVGFINQHGGWMCFDRANGAVTDHTLVQSYPCHFGPSQQWALNTVNYRGVNYWQIEAVTLAGPGSTQVVRSGQCIDLPSSSTQVGMYLQMYRCKTASDTSPENQLFYPMW